MKGEIKMEERQRNQIKSALLKCADENEGKVK